MNSGDSKEAAKIKAIEELQKHASVQDLAYFTKGLSSGDTGVLSHAISLVESNVELHRQIANDLMNWCMPRSGKSIRVGVTGVPGVGKSTYIEALGMHVISLGYKVAVLTIDPSSPLSKGSILGDKTRMTNLSMDPGAFIRPSPTSNVPGGVARSTRESILLCEAAGFDVVIVETVGVGQSETTVYEMTDFFLLLMLAGAGDQLQGIKRGIMEMADALLITKADSGNERAATHARAEYLSALHLFPPKDHGKATKVGLVSSVSKTGIVESWDNVLEHLDWMKKRGLFDQKRKAQLLTWMHESIDNMLRHFFYGNPFRKDELKKLESEVLEGKISPFDAAEKLMGNLLK